ncbi:hypothetical protein KPH14_009381 [Odynerus spinipes]|uniref:PRA1 family protein n=1 Tax=Odynerus spinipes TaxID=1348599 RepID=A0AAD9RPJ1_9HYME|nr:hypothetical protein KPH14_009381 [Odynerus spinipes]
MDTEITISGDMQTPPLKHNTTDGSDFLQFSQLQLNKLGYPQIYTWLAQRKNSIKPWSLFLNTHYIRSPPSITRLSKRIAKNIAYFQSNYFFVFIGLFIYCLITSPLLLLAVIASLGTCYKVSKWHANEGVSILGHKLSLAQLYTLVAICSLPLFLLVGAGGVLFWVLGASWFLITLHATFFNIDAIICPGEEELDKLIVEEV